MRHWMVNMFVNKMSSMILYKALKFMVTNNQKMQSPFLEWLTLSASVSA